MSYNKWKSTSVYGIFNNHDLTDASMNIITPCEATFDGQLTANTITSTTDINAVDGNFSNAVGIGNHLSVNSVSVNLSVEANEMNANTQISCNGHITGNTLGASTTIQGGDLHILGNADIDVDLNCYGNFNFIDMSGNTINNEVLNCNTSQETCTSSFSGTMIYTQPFRGNSYKKVIIYCNALIGSSSTTFNVAFTYTPIVTSGNSSLISALTTTGVTVTTSTSTSTFIILEGF